MISQILEWAALILVAAVSGVIGSYLGNWAALTYRRHMADFQEAQARIDYLTAERHRRSTEETP